jgi:hypothetical protein
VKFLFLDFDGVLNSSVFLHGKKTRRDEDMFDPRAVERLTRVLDQTGARIVVSSSWRHGRDATELEGLLHRVGLPARHRVAGVTGVGRTRGEEIRAWLFAYPGTVRRFAIVDDMSSMGRHLRACFVRTNPAVGLTDRNADQLLQILGYSFFNRAAL